MTHPTTSNGIALHTTATKRKERKKPEQIQLWFDPFFLFRRSMSFIENGFNWTRRKGEKKFKIETFERPVFKVWWYRTEAKTSSNYWVRKTRMTESAIYNNLPWSLFYLVYFPGIGSFFFIMILLYFNRKCCFLFKINAICTGTHLILHIHTHKMNEWGEDRMNDKIFYSILHSNDCFMRHIKEW